MEQWGHGGDVYRNRVRLDFSVNINPLGIPEQVRAALRQAADCCEQYPDIRQEELRGAIAEQINCGVEEILCGNGASELFPAIVRAADPKKIAIPVPSFYGYERAAGAGNARLCFPKLEERHGFAVTESLIRRVGGDAELLFLANPNNPTGGILPETELRKLLEECRRRGLLVVLDECFLGFAEGADSMISYRKEFPNLIVVRAFTKLYGIPGVRLGYLVCADAGLRAKVERQLPEWNLSVFAQMAGAAACRESAYREKTPGYVAREREFLEERLKQIFSESGYQGRVYPSEANFLLFYVEYPIYEGLLERGILIRDCSNYRGLGPGYYRIAVKNREENQRLLEEMEGLLTPKKRKESGVGGERAGS